MPGNTDKKLDGLNRVKLGQDKTTGGDEKNCLDFGGLGMSRPQTLCSQSAATSTM